MSPCAEPKANRVIGGVLLGEVLHLCSECPPGEVAGVSGQGWAPGPAGLTWA